MKVTLQRINQDYHLEALNDTGQTAQFDGSPDIGGHFQGFRPMQMLLASLGSCSAIDVISILKKQKQELRDLNVDVQAKREEGKVPSLFTDIHLHFELYGPIDQKKAERAVRLSMDKYCSVKLIMEKTATITADFSIHP
jgi:putative redox protein